MKKTCALLSGITLFLVVTFVAVSAFGCFAGAARYVVGDDMIQTGAEVIVEEKWNSLPLIVLFAAPQLCFAFSDKKKSKVFSLVGATIA